MQRCDGAFLTCAGYLVSLNDQAARVEISIRRERNLVILLGKHLIAGRGVDRPSSIQVRSLCWGRLSDEKYQQRQGIEGSHGNLLSKHHQASLSYPFGNPGQAGRLAGRALQVLRMQSW